MKIYEIGTGYTPIPAQIGAATEIVVEELTKAMLKQGLSVEILDIASKSRVENQLPIREVKVPSCFSGTDVQLGLMHKLKRVVYSVCLARALKKILKRSDEKVVLHFHNQYNLFFFLKMTSATLRKKCLIAYTNHSGIWRLSWEQIAHIARRRYFQEAECMKKADVVFVLNQETKRNAAQKLGVPEERLVLINNGVNTEIYHPLTLKDKMSAKEQFGLKDCRVILQVGSIYENKGQLRSAEFLLPLLKNDAALVFAYAGGVVDESYQRKIQTFSRDNGVSEQIRYLGMIPPGENLNKLYNTAEATILPSRYEGFSLVSVESCAAGVPVLVDRIGPVQFGVGSLLYDAESFGSVVADLLTEDTSELRKAARKNAKKQYSWEKIAEDYVIVLREKSGI